MNRFLLIPAAAVLLSSVVPAHAGDTLLIQRAQMARSIARPMRWMSMAQVEQRFGAPAQRLEPRGGQKSQWPVINRWLYPQYTVYFAHGHVVDIVLNHATPEEMGPAVIGTAHN